VLEMAAYGAFQTLIGRSVNAQNCPIADIHGDTDDWAGRVANGHPSNWFEGLACRLGAMGWSHRGRR